MGESKIMTPMIRQDNSLFFSGKKYFQKGQYLKKSTIESVFEFAYQMTFGATGEHRNHRSGGTHVRKQGEIFADTFQGKLAEFAIYNHLYKSFNINVPDLDVWKLGQWDSCDLIADDLKISVKSTKSFGQLLLLEAKDWNEEGEYIPNMQSGNSQYDIFILVRMNPFCDNILKRMSAYYVNSYNKEELKQAIMNELWEYDIPGFITLYELQEVIHNKQIIRKGEKINGTMPMDADNYYCQAIDMHPLSELIDYK